MAHVQDVTAAVMAELDRRVSTMKLQKLLYYSLAWHAVWHDETLFTARVEAWANGPVIPDVYQRHRGAYEVASWPGGDASHLTAKERATVRSIVHFYGGMTAAALSSRTHSEGPWVDARAGLPDGSRSKAVIAVAAMRAFYSAQQ